MSNLVELLLNTPKSKHNHLIERLDLIQGYNEYEIKQIEQRYNLSIHGQFKELLMTMGKCSGGLLFGNDISIYTRPLGLLPLEDIYGLGRQTEWQEEDDLEEFKHALNHINLIEKKFFEFADDGESRNNVYFLLTENRDNIIYDYEIEKGKVEPFGTLFDFLIACRKYSSISHRANEPELFNIITKGYLL